MQTPDKESFPFMPPAVLEHGLVARSATAAFREMDGKLFLVGPNANHLIQVNDTGAALWRFLERPHEVAALADRLAETFEVDRERALADCRAFVAQLAQRGLVSVT